MKRQELLRLQLPTNRGPRFEIDHEETLMSRFVRNVDFSSLSLLDLIQARDLFHAQLANLPNVIGTAVGRYLIRADSNEAKDPFAESVGTKPPRTIDNVVITKWSWPAVIVFVRKWQDPACFATDPQGYIPPRLYLADGRGVPVCVVEAPELTLRERTLTQPKFTSGPVAPGTAILRDAQEEERIGTVSCLVTDGADLYALTSAHVISGEEEQLFSYDDLGHRKLVATGSSAIRGSIPFSEAYPQWPGIRSFLRADVGLARITDVSDWSPRLPDGSRMGPVIDLSVDTLNLDLIGCPVKAFGAASGQMQGQVAALFYRYRSIGGSDYIADIMIGPRDVGENVQTRPGDSGAIWLWDAASEGGALKADDSLKQAIVEPRPLAVQWGGYAAGGSAGTGSQTEHQFALATSLSLACRVLDVEFVRDLGLERGEFWGKTGHYKVAWSACALVNDPFLSKLLLANRENISISDDDLIAGQVPAGNSKDFIALADVADLYWRTARPNDASNHFADMDNPEIDDPDNEGTKITLLEAWKNKSMRTIDYWVRYYESGGIDQKHQGALPFRAWQGYDLLVGYARDAKLPEFVCAAGCIAHYIGDACQPLHVSWLHHGHPDQPDEQPVHAIYETKMLDRYPNELVQGVNAKLKGKRAKRMFTGGAGAADHIVSLMSETLAALPPETIIKVFNDNPGRPRLQQMWDALGDATCSSIAAGALALSEYWEAAWTEGRGNAAAIALPTEAPDIAEAELMELYRDKTFLPSSFLAKMNVS